MNLRKKKELIARTFNVGKGKIIFVNSRLDEIKEAITKQDIRDLKEYVAIIIKEKSGRRSKPKHVKRSPGNVRKKIRRRKKDYMTLTRKFRTHIAGIKRQGTLSNEDVKEIRKRIKNKMFKSKSQLKEYMGGLGKNEDNKKKKKRK